MAQEAILHCSRVENETATLAREREEIEFKFMMEENIKIAINSKFQSSLYAELQVQEILWTRDYDIDEKSSGNRHRQLRKKVQSLHCLIIAMCALGVFT